MAHVERRTLAEMYAEIYAVIRRIPRGQVATYAQIAELIGVPRGGRISAAALKVSKPEHGLPWQRVVGKGGPNRGRIAIHDPVGAAVQRQLLEREKVAVNDKGFIDLGQFGWLPGDERAPTTAPKRRSAALAKRGASRR